MISLCHHVLRQSIYENAKDAGNTIHQELSISTGPEPKAYRGYEDNTNVCQHSHDLSSLFTCISLPQLRGGLLLTAVTMATWWPIIPPLLGSPSPSVPTNFTMACEPSGSTKIGWTIAGCTKMAQWRMEPHHWQSEDESQPVKPLG